ncbi:hypothetical protein PMAYCL1PPCAC_06836 [Pristionchus mayeri]|uniref:Lysozyme n=1 Tax=Pristionchus mayeri TaxID=1317129 RepID=A0AAN4ZCN0_9BILA|nr:hypothetical protein PMAYCL1PPCAC_06836 [Pristionchus mayeri]
MLLSLLISSSLLYSSSAQQYAYGVDINQQGSSSNFNCLRQNSYSTVFVRAYKPDGSGTVDSSAVANINMAFQAGLGIEVYRTMNPTSSKQAATQIDEAITALTNGGISVRSLWIQVTSPVNWNKNQATNVNFINSALQRIRNRGISPGVYTNNYDWQQITNQASNLGSDVMLWVLEVYSSGVGGETAPNFTDFRPFGNWKTAAVKQFGQYESVCGFTANRDVYPLSTSTLREKMMNDAKGDKHKLIYVGYIGL